jgi:hypothetical protein
MEVRCPSCSAQHRSEDYPGAFDILCGCGYLILNPELSSDSGSYNQVNFEGAPATSEDSKVLIQVQTAPTTEAIPPPPLTEENLSFTSDQLTPPEELPSGMLYDPTEVPMTTPEEKEDPKETPAKSQAFVERVQSASIGQILGPDYDLEFSELEQQGRLKARERIQKFLQDHKWLLEIMERRSFIIENIFQNERIERVPEALAVEIYIACLENGGTCKFKRHDETLNSTL